MTLDRASYSVARNQIEFSLGKERTSLSELRPDEFDELIREVLYGIDLRELRGFKTLKESLTRRPRNPVSFQCQDPLEMVGVPDDIKIKYSHPIESPLTLNSHVVRASRGVVSSQTVYRRYESGEETTDWSVANGWGSNQFYPRRVEESILMLHRPNDHTRGDENLFRVRYVFEKVVHANEMAVTEIVITKIPIDEFRDYFKSKYAQVGRDMIWEIRDLASLTLDELRGKTKRFQSDTEWLNRLGAGISE